MGKQLEFLADAATCPHVVLEVVPLSAGANEGMRGGPFVLADFTGSASPEFVQEVAEIRKWPRHGDDRNPELADRQPQQQQRRRLRRGGRRPRTVAVRDSKDPHGPGWRSVARAGVRSRAA